MVKETGYDSVERINLPHDRPMNRLIPKGGELLDKLEQFHRLLKMAVLHGVS
jgi:hypothetical protein